MGKTENDDKEKKEIASKLESLSLVREEFRLEDVKR